MRQESGRSLIEILGVMAIMGVMTVATISAYNTISKRQSHTIANTELEQIVKDAKILMESRGSYNGISVDYLIKAGALKNNNAPIGDSSWSIISSADGSAFIINLTNISYSDCSYFATATPKWATATLVNGYETEPASHCFSSATNQMSFIIQ